MLRLQTALPTEPVLVAQIHDELLVECRENDAEDAANIMRVEMTAPVALAVKIALEDLGRRLLRRSDERLGAHQRPGTNDHVGRYCRAAATIATLLRCVSQGMPSGYRSLRVILQ